MRRLSHIVVLVSLSFVWLLVLERDNASACSGGAPLTIRGLLTRSDYVVKARPIESDDAGQNVILQVESYLTGGAGPEFLLFTRNDPVITEYIRSGHSGGGDCLGLASPLRSEDTIYIFLKRNDNGSFTAAQTLINFGIYRFPERTSTVEVFLEGGIRNGDQILEDFAEPGSGQRVTEDEIVNIIASESGDTPTPPDVTSPYPLKAPLLITTQSESYMLPIDGRRPVSVTEETFSVTGEPLSFIGRFAAARSCEQDGCAVISADKLNIAILHDDNTIALTSFNFDLTSDNIVEGQAVNFSTTSDTIAVWNDCQLAVYTTGYPRLLQSQYEIVLLSSVDLIADDCAVFHQAATWSTDGRQLAYADERGIWLWHVFNTNGEAELILTNDAAAPLVPRHFSPLGNYLNYSDGEARSYLDLAAGAILPDGIISPDDRILVKFDTASTQSAFEICSLTPFTCQQVGGQYIETFNDRGERTSLTDVNEIVEIAWRDNSRFITRACLPNSPQQCAVFEWRPGYFSWGLPELLGIGYDFDYDTVTDALAIVQDESTLLINGVVVDTSEWFDGAIESVEWLPSLFYYS